MTYQYITLKMIEEAKTNGGYIDQTAFKTEKQYMFDTVILSAEVMQIIDSYVSFVRPKMSPSCNYLLLTTNGKQYSALGSAMSILVHQAIEKYVNPTRYRQIIESESAERLTTEEMKAISADQKHSSYVAKRIYQKKLSRDIAHQGKTCMEKIRGNQGEEHTKEMANLVSEDSSLDIVRMEEVGDPQTHSCDGTDKGGSHLVTNDEVEEVLSVLSLTELETKEEEEEEVHSKTISSEVTLSVDSSPGIRSESDSIQTSVADPGPSTSGHCTRARRSALSDMPQRSDMTVDVKKECAEDEVNRGLVQKRFSPEEDSVLKEGIKKYGLGKWSVMLKDKSLNFHPARTRDSIRVRADTLGLSKQKKKGLLARKKK